MDLADQLIEAVKAGNLAEAGRLCTTIRETILVLTPPKFAAKLLVTRAAVHNWEKDGKIPLKRAEAIKKLVISQGKEQEVTGSAESLRPEQVIERICKCKTVWLLKGATAFQAGLFGEVGKKLEDCLSGNTGLLEIKYVFPMFDNYKPLHNTPLKSFLRFKSRLKYPMSARVVARPVTNADQAFRLCISASPAGLIILDYGDEFRELIIELWDREEHQILRKLSNQYATQIYEGMAPVLKQLEDNAAASSDLMDRLMQDPELTWFPGGYNYPR